MDKTKKTGFFAAVFSLLYLMAAVGLLLGVCGHCYPGLGRWVDTLIAGNDDSPVRAAFNTLSDGLEAGVPLKEAAQTSFAVLIGDAN